VIGEKRHNELLALRLEVKELRARIRVLEAAAARNPAQPSADGDDLIILGVRYSLALFQAFAFAPPGAVLQIVSREAGGSVTVRTITTEIDARRVLREVQEREAAAKSQMFKGAT